MILNNFFPGYPPPNVVWMMDGIALPKSTSEASTYYHPYAATHVEEKQTTINRSQPTSNASSNDVFSTHSNLFNSIFHSHSDKRNRKNFLPFPSEYRKISLPVGNFSPLIHLPYSRKSSASSNVHHLQFPPIRLAGERSASSRVVSTSPFYFHRDKMPPFSFNHLQLQKLRKIKMMKQQQQKEEQQQQTLIHSNKLKKNTKVFSPQVVVSKPKAERIPSGESKLIIGVAKQQSHERQEPTSDFPTIKSRQRQGPGCLNSADALDLSAASRCSNSSMTREQGAAASTKEEQKKSNVDMEFPENRKGGREMTLGLNEAVSRKGSQGFGTVRQMEKDQEDKVVLRKRSLFHVDPKTISKTFIEYTIDGKSSLEHISGSMTIQGKITNNHDKFGRHRTRPKKSISTPTGSFQPLGNEGRDSFKYFENDLQSSFETEDEDIMPPNKIEISKPSLKNRSTNELKSSFPRVTGRAPTGIEDEVHESEVSSVLEIGPLTRADNGKVFTCWADNSKLTTPKTRPVKISMIRKYRKMIVC